MMEPTIDVGLSCIGWLRACPTAQQLVRDAARQGLAGGMAALGFAPKTTIELGITLADAAAQQRLNRDYRGRDSSTNVLAFPAWEPRAVGSSGAPILLGDVTLAFET